MGFDEVVLDNFRFPASDQYIFNGDKPAALSQAAATLISACQSNEFVLSFCVEDPAFPLPEGRTRLYFQGIAAADAAMLAAQTGVADPAVKLVFLTDLMDTRFDSYGVLRPLPIEE